MTTTFWVPRPRDSLNDLLQPLADPEIREDPPGFVYDHDPLCRLLVALGLDLGLQPGRGARHQDPQGRCVCYLGQPGG